MAAPADSESFRDREIRRPSNSRAEYFRTTASGKLDRRRNAAPDWRTGNSAKPKAADPPLAVQQKLIVIPAKTCVNRPVSQPDQILHERRLLEVGPIGGKSKGERRAGIELIRIHGDIGNDVIEILVEESIVGFDA